MFIEKWHIMDNDYVTFSEVSEDDATISEYTTIENGPSETKLATEITPEVRTAEKLNPYLGELPEYHQAYRHPSHCHPLLAVFNREGDGVECNNMACERRISHNTTCFHCPLCVFDLCGWCFQLDSTGKDKSLPVNPDAHNRKIPILAPLSNPYVAEVPQYHQAYRHPSHCHPLLVVFNREDDIECSNKSCGRCISQNTTCFHCPLCDFDLCQWCFQLDYAGEDKSLPVNQYNYNRRIPVLKPLSVTV